MIKCFARYRYLFWKKKYYTLKYATEKVDQNLAMLNHFPAETTIEARINIAKTLSYYKKKAQQWKRWIST